MSFWIGLGVGIVVGVLLLILPMEYRSWRSWRERTVHDTEQTG